MTQEQKEKLEHKAKDYIKPFAHQLHLGADEVLIMDLVGFAQTILDNPGEWGLTYPNSQKLSDEVIAMQAENERYRKALERIATFDYPTTVIAPHQKMTHKEQKDWTENVRWADDRQALLDDFAKAAMQGIISNGWMNLSVSDEQIAKEAYDIAEAMMQERERRIKK